MEARFIGEVEEHAPALQEPFMSKFTQKRVVQHIEKEMMRRSERPLKLPHSDMDRSRFLSNSLREDHPSITSPNLSITARGSHLHRM